MNGLGQDPDYRCDELGRCPSCGIPLRPLLASLKVQVHCDVCTAMERAVYVRHTCRGCLGPLTQSHGSEYCQTCLAMIRAVNTDWFIKAQDREERLIRGSDGEPRDTV